MTSTAFRTTIAAATLFVVVALIPVRTPAFKHLKVGMPAPIVSGSDVLTRNHVSSEPQSGDRAIVVTFWATWSPRSRQILDDLKSAVEEHRGEGLRVIAVNVENQAIPDTTRGRIARFLADLELPFPVIIDTTLTRFYQYGVIAVPSTAILDANGTIRFAPPGYSLTTRDRIADTLKLLLGGPPPKPVVAPQGHVPIPRASRYYHLALQMAGKRMYERALWSLRQSDEIDSNFAAVHVLRGQIFLKLDSNAAAAREFQTAIVKDSVNADAWAGWGHLALAERDHDAAYERLATALSIDKLHFAAMMDLALTQAASGAPSAALDSLDALRKLYPLDPGVHNCLGRVYLISDQLDSAVSAFRTSLNLLHPSP